MAPEWSCSADRATGDWADWRDSDIAEAVTVAMMERGILVLPIHDSFLVDYRYAETHKEEMARACRDHLGTPIEIEEDESVIEGLGSMSEGAVDRFMAGKETSPGMSGIVREGRRSGRLGDGQRPEES